MEKTDNELIAEFMGGTFEEREFMTYGGKRSGKWTFLNGKWCYDDQLDYNTSWDWLMPVVAKMLDMSLGKAVSDQFVERVLEFSGTSILYPLPGVYKKVVEFIKWYNQHNLKESDLIIKKI